MQFFKSNGFSLGRFLVEIFTIIFGVLLALGVNEFRQHENEKRLVNTAVQSIKIEVQRNKKFLDSRILYYDSMIDTLDHLIKKRGNNFPFSPKSIPGFSGINPPLLRNSSLQTAISTQAFSYMDYKTADNISFVYSFQKTYLKWVYIYFNALVNREKTTIKTLWNLFKEMSFVGKEVEQNYTKLLKDLSEM